MESMLMEDTGNDLEVIKPVVVETSHNTTWRKAVGNSGS